VLASRLRYAQALGRRGHAHDADTARHELATAAEEAATLGIARPRDGDGREQPVACTRRGRNWRIDVGHRSVLVEHSIGMLQLAVLVANPGAEIPAVDLAAGVAVLGNAAADTATSAQPTLDQAATRQYRQRLARLRTEIDDLESGTEDDRAPRARAERDWLLAELAAATGIGGRTRRFTDNAERARIAVGKAIRRALTRVGDIDPVIGEYLRGSVHTGLRCSYRPT
jgi:hypothetical protein